jgi:uncharacterized protein YndB with AHSA1/START domain
MKIWKQEKAMEQPTPLHFVFYFAVSPEKVWEGLVSAEVNRVIFMGAEFAVDLRPGGAMTYSGPGPDGKPMTYVRCQILDVEPERLLRYSFAMGGPEKGGSETTSRVTVELTAESEATKVAVTHDEWKQDDEKTYAECADGWPRILSRMKTLLETGKTFRPH